MERYIQQLIEDFNRAEADPVPEQDFGDSYEEFEEMMHKIESNEHIEAKQLLGVSYEELPPPEMLTAEQMQRLLIAILNALSAKGTEVSFPGNGIPVELAYRETRALFKEGFQSVPGWIVDFCTGWCPDCAFVDYCDAWKETWTKEELEKERMKNNQRKLE